MSHCMRGCKRIFSSFHIKENTSIYAEKRDLFIKTDCKTNKSRYKNIFYKPELSLKKYVVSAVLL